MHPCRVTPDGSRAHYLIWSQLRDIDAYILTSLIVRLPEVETKLCNARIWVSQSLPECMKTQPTHIFTQSLHMPQKTCSLHHTNHLLNVPKLVLLSSLAEKSMHSSISILLIKSPCDQPVDIIVVVCKLPIQKQLPVHFKLIYSFKKQYLGLRMPPFTHGNDIFPRTNNLDTTNWV